MLKSIGGVAVSFFCVFNYAELSKKSYTPQRDILLIKMNCLLI